jgi:hypothetical protein
MHECARANTHAQQQQRRAKRGAAPTIVPRLPCGLPLITAEGAAADARRLARRKEERRRLKETKLAAEHESLAEIAKRAGVHGGEAEGGNHRLFWGGEAGGELLIESSSQRLLLACIKESSIARERDSLQPSSVNLSCVTLGSLADRVDEAAGAGSSVGQMKLQLLEAFWTMISPANHHHAVCVEGLLRQGLYDVILFWFQSRLGRTVDEEDLLALKIFRRLLTTIQELSAKSLTPRQIETTVGILKRNKESFQTVPFNYFESEAMKMLASLSKVLVFEPAQMVVKQGSSEPCSYIVLSGRLQMAYVSVRHKKLRSLFTLRAGDLFGHGNLMENEPEPRCHVSKVSALVFLLYKASVC